MKKVQAILLLGLLSCESTGLDIITPDSFGVGKSEGSLDAVGKATGSYYGNWDNGWGNHGWEDGGMHLDTKTTGTTESTSYWLTWDLPDWEEPPTKYEGISVAQLEQAIEARMLTLADVEKAIDERMPKVIEVPIIIPPAETIDIQEVKNELKRELSPFFIAGFFAFLGLLGGVFLVSKLRG